MTSKCINCESESPKYKCPNCYSSYCSSKCCKEHKKTDVCKKPENKEDIAKTVKEKQYVTEDTVPVEKLQRLSYNKDLKQLLKNSLLQKLLISVDDSPDPSEAIQKAMQDPGFVKFVDLCLETTEDLNVNELDQF